MCFNSQQLVAEGKVEGESRWINENRRKCSGELCAEKWGAKRRNTIICNLVSIIARTRDSAARKCIHCQRFHTRKSNRLLAALMSGGATETQRIFAGIFSFSLNSVSTPHFRFFPGGLHRAVFKATARALTAKPRRKSWGLLKHTTRKYRAAELGGVGKKREKKNRFHFSKTWNMNALLRCCIYTSRLCGILEFFLPPSPALSCPVTISARLNQNDWKWFISSFFHPFSFHFYGSVNWISYEFPFNRLLDWLGLISVTWLDLTHQRWLLWQEGGCLGLCRTLLQKKKHPEKSRPLRVSPSHSSHFPTMNF